MERHARRAIDLPMCSYRPENAGSARFCRQRRVGAAAGPAAEYPRQNNMITRLGKRQRRACWGTITAACPAILSAEAHNCMRKSCQAASTAGAGVVRTIRGTLAPLESSPDPALSSACQRPLKRANSSHRRGAPAVCALVRVAMKVSGPAISVSLAVGRSGSTNTGRWRSVATGRGWPALGVLFHISVHRRSPG